MTEGGVPMPPFTDPAQDANPPPDASITLDIKPGNA